MKLFFTSSNSITSVVDSLIPQYNALGLEITANHKDADIIISTDHVKHLNNVKSKIGIMMSVDERFKISMNLRKIPRTSNAQFMDVLSSFAYMIGYQAAILAMAKLDKLMFTTNVTGTLIHGTKAMVIGIGVAGLNAIATLRKMGAEVLGLDITDDMKGSVTGFGASFKIIEANNKTEIIDNYNRYRPDIIITSVPAQIELIDLDMLNEFNKCIIIDLSTCVNGSNCIFSRDKETYYYNDVTIIGASTLTKYYQQMSEIYSRNIFNLIKLYINNPNHQILSSMIEYKNDVI